MSNIPRSFWHALSFCMVSATLGLLWIAYSATTVSIEIANAKIELSSAISQAKDIKGELEAENARLIAANDILRNKIEDLESLATQEGASINIEELKAHGILGGESSEVRKLLRDPKTDLFEDLDRKIENAEQVLQKK